MPFFSFFFNDTATTEIYTLSLHDALPICAADQRFPGRGAHRRRLAAGPPYGRQAGQNAARQGAVGRYRPRRVGLRRSRADRKSTRLNSSNQIISYAVFCLKKKNNTTYNDI